MKSKREFILASAAAVPALAMFALTEGKAAAKEVIKPMRTTAGTSAAYFPNVIVTDHTGKDSLWYDDVIREKVVMINFFSIESDKKFGVTDNISGIHKLAEARGFTNVDLISVAQDAPSTRALARYAQEKGVNGNWRMFTAKPAIVELIRSYLFIKKSDPVVDAAAAHNYNHNHSLAVARYGNEALGRWAAFPLLTRPESVVKRFEWLGSTPEEKKG